MTKYDPVVVYRPAFDDGQEGIPFLHSMAFDDPKEAKKFTAELNDKERARLKGKDPDTAWFVLKCTTRFAEAWNPPGKKIVAKKRVVKKTAS